MLRRAASSLVARAAGLPRIPPPPAAAATLVQRHAESRLATPAPLPRLGGAGARGFARMARRIPPTRPDGYSSSDGEADAFRDGEEAAPEAGTDGDENVEFMWKMLDLGRPDRADENSEGQDATEEEEEEEELSVGGDDPAPSEVRARRLRKCL